MRTFPLSALAFCTSLLACGSRPQPESSNDGKLPAMTVAPDARPPIDGGGAPDEGQPWSVASVSGLVLWLDGSQGLADVNGTVTEWYDQSGAGNDARPEPNVPAPTVSLINGKRALHFDARPGQPAGTQLTIPDSASLQWGTNDFYLATIVRWTNNAADQDILQYAQGLFYGKFGGVQQGVQLYGNIYNGGGGDSAGVAGWANDYKAFLYAGVNDGVQHLVELEGRGGLLDVYVDGKKGGISGSASVDKSAPGAPVWIGAAYGKLYRLNGDIGEIIAANGAIETADRSAIETYLKAKYATP